MILFSLRLAVSDGGRSNMLYLYNGIASLERVACEPQTHFRSSLLSLRNIGLHQNKRFYVTEIVLPLGFADAIFRRERSDDRKCVCGSQARSRRTPNTANRNPVTTSIFK